MKISGNIFPASAAVSSLAATFVAATNKEYWIAASFLSATVAWGINAKTYGERYEQ